MAPAMTARSRRCPASWRSPAMRRAGRRVRALPSATCCRAPRPRSASPARCSSATQTGKGQFVDVSMLEASLAFLSGQVADYSVAGHRQQLSGNQAVSRKATANLFRAGDGHLLLAVNNEKQYRALMTALGREDAFDDPRFVDWFARQENEPALRAI